MYLLHRELIRTISTKDGYIKLKDDIKPELFDSVIRTCITGINKYWKKYKDHTVIAPELLAFLLPTDQEYKAVLSLISEPNQTISTALIRELKSTKLAKDLTSTVENYSLGEDIDLYDTCTELLSGFEVDLKRSTTDDYCKISLEDIIQDEMNGLLLTPELKCLQKSMPGLRTGMQVIVAARPGKGKTSFCASLITGFKSLHGRPILWFNNEGKAIRIKGTCMRAGLNMDFNQIALKGYKECESEFYSKIGGKDRLRIYDIHGRTYQHLENIIKEVKPIVVVWDMLDNVQGFNTVNSRTDQRLEALYQWARECSVKYDFLSIPTSQVSTEGSELQWIPDTFLKDSRTGKQGACDAIITIGAQSKVGFENSRFIFIPKTKFQPEEGFHSDCRTEVVFKNSTANFIE